MVEKVFIDDKIKSEISPLPNENTSLETLHGHFIKFKYFGSLISKYTVRNYNTSFDLLLKFNPKLELKDLTEDTIISFLVFLNTRKRQIGKDQLVRAYKNSSLAAVRSSLNCFFEWLVERAYILENPFKKIPYPKVAYTDSRAFSPKEFETICYAVDFKIQWGSLLIKKRNIAMVMLLFFTGVRKEEFLGLKLSDVDLDRKQIRINAETSKSKRTRIIPINLQLKSHLEDYLFFRNTYTSNSFWISGTLDRPFTEHGAKHLIKFLTSETKINCHLHRFRHTFATNYYKQTHDLVGLKKLMGHASLKMTLVYLRSLPDEHVVEQIQRMSLAEFL